jgi:hypothetical protein
MPLLLTGGRSVGAIIWGFGLGFRDSINCMCSARVVSPMNATPISVTPQVNASTANS